MPDASFSSMKRGIGSRAKRSPRSATVAGSGKAMGLGLSSPGNRPVERTSMFTPCSVSRSFAGTRHPLDVTPAQVIALERLQVVVAHHKIHVHSDTPVAVLVQRERPDNRIGEPIGLQDGSQLVERELGIGLSHEE